MRQRVDYEVRQRSTAGAMYARHDGSSAGCSSQKSSTLKATEIHETVSVSKRFLSFARCPLQRLLSAAVPVVFVVLDGVRQTTYGGVDMLSSIRSVQRLWPSVGLSSLHRIFTMHLLRRKR